MLSDCFNEALNMHRPKKSFFSMKKIHEAAY